MGLGAYRKIPARILHCLNSILVSVKRGGPCARFRSSSGPPSIKSKTASAKFSSDNELIMGDHIISDNADSYKNGFEFAIPAAFEGHTAASASPAAFLSTLSGHPDRVVGCMLGKMCGDVLGAGVEGWSPADIQLSNPDGLKDFLHTERGFGCYTDDTQMAIALTRSLVACDGRIDAVHAARSYADDYQPYRGYGATAHKILSGIKRGGIDAESIATIGTKYIPGGSFGNGGAMRIAPLALAYRHAPPEVLQPAVAAALRCTHVHPVAIDGAFVIALAIGYLATRHPQTLNPPSAATVITDSSGQSKAMEKMDSTPTVCHDAIVQAGVGSKHVGNTTAGDGLSMAGATANAVANLATPTGLMDHVLSYTGLMQTESMVLKLHTIKAFITQVRQYKSPTEPWAQYLASSGWLSELELQNQVSEPFQIRADDAAAAALAALCCHWDCPEDAVIAAVHYGGDTDTVAAITGGLAGALYGTRWLPARWLDNLENGTAGRDEVIQLAVKLAHHDTANISS